ncbi:MAG: flippase-like domain-containing protein [Muribaculaceae bacterium]|nr:flippase-like domain-containing protein [Muribaculaceae bacterium]
MHNETSILYKIAIPIVIGIGVILWMFYNEYQPGTWDLITFDTLTITAIILAWLFMLGRDFGLAWRFKEITDKQLTWHQAIKVTFLCEFASAITPSIVGGSALGMIFLKKEGIELGKGTALMLTTIFLDEILFVLLCPLIIAIIPTDTLFHNFELWDLEMKWIFWIAYSAIAIWTAILFIGIFIKPNGVKNLLISTFKLKWLKRWQNKIATIGENIVTTSKEIKKRPFKWWAKAFVATLVSWLSRFMVVNALLLAFAPLANQLLILCRQVSLWLILTICPTPGGSGLSEELFTNYYNDLISSGSMDIASIAIILALFWRIITYYVYLVIGVFLLPSFLKASNENKKQ